MRIQSIIARLHNRQDFKYFPILLFTFAFLLRLGLILTLKTYSSPYHFSEHVAIANRILAGKGYSYHWYGLGAAGEGSFMPPLYVAVVLMAEIAFPSMPWLAIQVFQASLSACTAVMIYFVGREVFTKTCVGIVSSFLVAIYPPVLGYVIDIQAVTLETFLVALTVLACIYWRKRRTWKYASVLGLALGLTVLSRSNLILLLPLLFTWMVLCHGRRGAIHFVAAICAFTLVLGPWVLRNYLVHRKPVLVSTNGGFTFFMGNNMNATGFCYPDLGDVWKQYPELAKELAQLGEAERDRRLYQEGMDFIRTHPKQALSLALKRSVYFWWFKPGYTKGGVMSGYPWYFGLIYIVSYMFVLCFSMLGLVLSFEEYRSLFILYALFSVQMFVTTIFEGGTRFRTILEPLLIVLAAYGIAWALPMFSRVFPSARRVTS